MIQDPPANNVFDGTVSLPRSASNVIPTAFNVDKSVQVYVVPYVTLLDLSTSLI